MVADILHLYTAMGGSAGGMLDNAWRVFAPETKSGLALTSNWQ